MDHELIYLADLSACAPGKLYFYEIACRRLNQAPSGNYVTDVKHLPCFLREGAMTPEGSS